MKKILLSLILMAFAATTMTAQTATQPAAQVKKECCKNKKMDGKKCDKPADQQCPDCKAQAAKQCDKAAKQCDKATGMKHECKKAEGMKHECKEGKKHECKKAEGMKCDKANAEKKDCCKDKKMDGKKCDKPADQQCPDCKDKAAKKD